MFQILRSIKMLVVDKPTANQCIQLEINGYNLITTVDLTIWRARVQARLNHKTAVVRSASQTHVCHVPGPSGPPWHHRETKRNQQIISSKLNQLLLFPIPNLSKFKVVTYSYALCPIPEAQQVAKHNHTTSKTLLQRELFLTRFYKLYYQQLSIARYQVSSLC